jgi:hypothetical protein
MAWTSHDQFFGWVHSFKLNRNNYIFGGRFGTNERPYPIIVNRPSVHQVLGNWNAADTGLVLTAFFAGLLLARRWAFKDTLTESIIERRNDFKRLHRVIVGFALALALRNSSYRLEGYVPNGLPRQNRDLVKYDFTSELVNTTFWKYFVESHDKPTIRPE